MLDTHSVHKKSKGHSQAADTEHGKSVVIMHGNGCSHLHLDCLFVKTEDGCIMRCGDCKSIIIKHCPCTTEEAVTDADVSGLLPCAQRRAQVFF